MRPPNFPNARGAAVKPTRLSERGLSAMDVGIAAEHLVCADLIMAGVPAFLADQGSPFDVVADCDTRLVRVQVKATLAPRNMNATGQCVRMGYSWSVRVRGKGGQGARLDERHCEVVALVAMDIKQIAYFPVSVLGTTMQLNPPGVIGRQRGPRNWIGDVASFPFGPALRGDLAFYRRRPFACADTQS